MRVHYALLLFYLTFGVWSVPSIATAQGEWVTPRTTEGRPDLQGVWLSHAAIPMERPVSLAGRPRLTDEEVSILQERAERIFRNGRSAFATPEGAFRAAFDNVETYDAWSTSSSIGMVDVAVTNQTSLVVDPPDGRIPEVTPQARARRAQRAVHRQEHPADTYTDRPLAERCVSYGVPSIGAGYNSYFQIFQSKDYVVVYQEMIHDARVIPIGDHPALPESIRQLHGDSRAHWEGDTLVIETSNYTAESTFRGATRDLQGTERFTRTGPDILNYDVTFEDTATWVKPWTASIPLRHTDDAIFEYACHEGNIGMEGILAGHRAEERATADETGSEQ